MSVYDFTVKGMDGKSVELAKYKDKALLIVNTATQCGFTPQYTDLEKIYESYKDRGFEILDFPCNQFKEQAPEEIAEIDQICRVKFGTQFPRFAKIDVNGAGSDPLYTYLKDQKSFAGFDYSHALGEKVASLAKEANPEYEQSSDIKWNFTKFLIDRNGNVVQRFEPTHNLDDVAQAIEKVL